MLSVIGILGKMNHKRKKPKNSRAGCLMCKPNKMNGVNKDILGHTGFGKLRDTLHAKEDLKDNPKEIE
jgi:hypothetical protein